MQKTIVVLTLLILLATPVVSWDRYQNETEYFIGSYSFKKIMRYSFTITGTQVVTLETKNTTGDTYMYLWSNTEQKQVSKNDDGGVGLCSKITSTLKPGSYRVFIRSYGNNATSTCDLYKNGVKVVSNGRYSGYKVYVGSHEAETKFLTKNLSSGGDTYCLLVNNSYDLIGYDDDAGYLLASAIVASEEPRYFIVGSYSNSSEGTCQVFYRRDNNIEFLSLCGDENRHAVSGNTFKNYFDSGDYYYSNVLASRNWMFRGGNRMSYVDGVDLVYIHCHGSPGEVKTENSIWTDFTHPDGSCGSGHRTHNKSGDLEYIAFMSCQTVRIENEDTWGWLKTRGWQSYYDSSGNLKKGFFDGVHIVVGYHSDHHNVSRAFLSHKSYWYEAKYFANNLDDGKTIWEAWKKANQSATDKVQHWLWCPDVDLGVISSIHVVPNGSEALADHKSRDYTIGDSGYYFGWRKRHYWYD